MSKIDAEIVAVWQDGCDLVLLTRTKAKFRILAETMIGTIKETRAYVVEMMNRPVRLWVEDDRCEFIFDAV